MRRRSCLGIIYFELLRILLRSRIFLFPTPYALKTNVDIDPEVRMNGEPNNCSFNNSNMKSRSNNQQLLQNRSNSRNYQQIEMLRTNRAFDFSYAFRPSIVCCFANWPACFCVLVCVHAATISVWICWWFWNVRPSRRCAPGSVSGSGTRLSAALHISRWSLAGRCWAFCRIGVRAVRSDGIAW